MMYEGDYFHDFEPVQPVPAPKKVHSHYEILKVSRAATQAEIRLAYRRLVSEYHPDRNKTLSAVTVTQRINKAYDILSDSARRAEHDEWIRDEERRLNPPRPAYTAPQSPEKPKQTQYARDPVDWNPEHAVAFRRFVQEKRIEWDDRFNEVSTDLLYMTFVQELRHQEFMAKMDEKTRKAKVLVFCSCLAIFSIVAMMLYGLIR
jgi:curved DNA-binding protein CbpA